MAQQRIQEQGTGRTPTSAFANNPYQLSRGAVSSAVASSLTGGSPTLGPSPSTHQFAIHQLPRAASSTGGRAASASVRRSASPIAIPAGGALPLSPSNSTSVANRRQTLIQQQAALSQSRQRADSMPGTSPGSDGYNPYLLAEASMPASQQMFRKTKNLEQRLAEYLKPPRVSPNAAAAGSPGAAGSGSIGSPSASPTNARGNISVNVLLHPKTPLGSLTSPTGATFSTVTAANKEMLARASAAAREEKDEGRGSPLRAGRRGEAIDEDELAAAQAAELMASVKKGKSKAAAAEEEAAAAAIAATAAAEAAKPPPEDDAAGSDSANQAPAASMNLRAVLKEKKAQELEAKAAAARDQEAKKPWTGISWHDVVQARLFLLAHNKAKLAAQASGLPVPDLKEEVRTKNVNALALQVATNWLSSTSLKNASSKKPFNIFTLSEFQRQEYKIAQEQGKWLTMVAKEDALKKELDYLPNDQKRISSKTRMMNMCKGEVTQQQAGGSSNNDGSSGSGSSGGNSGSSGGGGGLGAKSSLLYNTYVSCNGQYGYVRYVGRVSWGSGLWVGMELVEKHPYAASANAPWVDFYHEHSAVSMQLIEETAEQKAEQRKRVRALMAGSVADQIAAASTGGPTSQMMINTLIPRPLLMAAMIAPVKDKNASGSKSSSSGEKEKIVGTAEGQFQPLANSIFPFIDVVAFLREGLAGCFEMQEVDPGFAYFAPMDSVRRVALKAKIDNKALLSAKEHQTNPFADVDDLATNTPKKHEGNIEMLARYLTVSDREVLDGDRNKARSIFRWICHNIRYDPTGTGAGAPGAASAVASPVVGSKATDVISIIRHRRATAEGFAQLFHALCVAGGLQCLRIRGVEKQLNQRTDQVLRNKHAWNAIKVDGEWSFVDCVFSCGQWVDPPSGSSASAQAAQALARASVHQGTWAQMFSDAYFCTPPSLFILEHFPTSCDDPFNKVLPQEYNNLQLLRSVVSASEFEKGLIPGRAFVEYQMRASPFTYAVECKQPSYQIEITAPSFILFDVDMSIKSHVVDLSQCVHIGYDGESVTIYLIFPVPGEYVVKISCKPSWRELDIYEKCLTYRMTSHTGLVPLASNKDVIIGYLQHRKVNARDSRALFNRHFTLLHPLSGHLIPKAPFIVQLKGPEIADSVVVACNGDWQRLSSSTLSKSTSGGGSSGPGSGVKMFEGTCFPELDHRVLTDRGFMFLSEIERALQDGPLLFAAFDVHSRSMVFVSGRVVIPDKAAPAALVEFTDAETRPHWDENSTEYGMAAGPVAGSRAKHLSLRVTADHTMFMQTGDQDVPFRKVPAGELTSSFACSCPPEDHCLHRRDTIAMLSRAPAGVSHPAHTPMSVAGDRSDVTSLVSVLGLITEQQLDAFLTFYGYWLNDGSLSYRDAAGSTDAVVVCTVKEEAFLRDVLGACGLLDDGWSVSPPNGAGVIRVMIQQPSWFSWFNDEHIESGPCLPSWVLKRLSSRQLRLVIEGLRVADDHSSLGREGQSGVTDTSRICTSSVGFRDQLVQLLMQAGFTPHCRLQMPAGTLCYRHDGRNFTAEERQLYPDLHFQEIVSTLDVWSVHWSDEHDSNLWMDKADVAFDGSSPVRGKQKHGEGPGSSRSSPYRLEVDGRLWCVEVDHPDHLIFVQRAFRSKLGVVTKMSKPVVVGNCVIQPRYDLQIFYEHDKKFHLLFYYRANLTSFSNVYLEKDKAAAVAAASSSSTSSFLTQDLWHGKCVLGIEGRVFDANLSLDVPACKFGRSLCIFIIHVSTAWDVALQVQEGWRNGTPLQDNQVVVEEMKNARTQLMTQYKITTTLPATAMLNPVPEEPRSSPTNKLRSAVSSVIGAGSSSMPAGVQAAADFANSLAEGPEKRRALEEAERRRRIDNKIPYATSGSGSGGGKDDDAPKASTQYVLVINARSIKQGGPMRYCLSYFFDVAKTGQQAATTNQAQLQLTTDD